VPTIANRRINGVDAMYWSRRDEKAPHAPENFGDVIGPMLVERLAPSDVAATPRSLMTVGSILHLAPKNAVVWGSGINGKVSRHLPTQPQTLDVRAVRGPYTRAILRAAGVDCPEVYGDPALLLPELWPELSDGIPRGGGGVLIVPNLNEMSAFGEDPRVCSPLQDLGVLAQAILTADLVVGSSLHAVVLADAYGVPARLVAPSVEHPVKYLDYLAGTGRHGTRVAATVDQAIELGGHRPPEFDLPALVAAFPADLWGDYPIAPVPLSPLGPLEALVELCEHTEQGGADAAVLAPLQERYLASAVKRHAHREAPDVVRSAMRRLDVARPDAIIGDDPGTASESSDAVAEAPHGRTTADRARLASRAALLGAIPGDATCESLTVDVHSNTVRLGGITALVAPTDNAQLQVGVYSERKSQPLMTVEAEVRVTPTHVEWFASFDLNEYRQIAPRGVRLSWHPNRRAGARFASIPSAQFDAQQVADVCADDGPLLSVVVPVHNVDEWLRDLLDSVLAQKVPSMEVIAVNDHSSDSSRELLGEYAQRDGRVRVVDAYGYGGANARNVGANCAAGRYIVFADADDIVPDDGYAALVASLEHSGSDLAAGDFLKFSPVETWRPSAAWDVFDETRQRQELPDVANLIRGRAVWNKMFRTEFWRREDIHFPEVPRSNDIVPMMTAYLAANAIDTVSDCVYLYRDRPGASSMTARAGAIRGLLSYLEQELACARMVHAFHSEEVLSTYTRLLVESDVWIHLLRYAESGEQAEPQQLADASDFLTEILHLLFDWRLERLPYVKVAALTSFAAREYDDALALLRDASASADSPSQQDMARAWITALRVLKRVEFSPEKVASRIMKEKVAPYLWGALSLGSAVECRQFADDARTLVNELPVVLAPTARWDAFLAMDELALEQWSLMREVGGLEVAGVELGTRSITLTGPAMAQMQGVPLEIFVGRADSRARRPRKVSVVEGPRGVEWTVRIPVSDVRGSSRHFAHLRMAGKMGAALSLRVSEGALREEVLSPRLRISRATGKREGSVELRRRRILSVSALRAGVRGIRRRLGR
jgi:glycosyltransferase involved in cell wall biosynthesis